MSAPATTGASAQSTPQPAGASAACAGTLSGGLAALDLLSEAFRCSTEGFGREEAMASAISLIVANAFQWKQAGFYCGVLRVNADILEGLASDAALENSGVFAAINGKEDHEPDSRWCPPL